MMIDYDKLKIAHELADKLSKITNGHVQVSCKLFIHREGSNFCHYELSIDNDYGLGNGVMTNMDDLITKLRELTQSEPKYKKGQTVWTLTNHEAPDDIIEITLNQDINDDEGLYPSKAALIEAQIEYWSNMQYSQEPLPINNRGRGERELNPTFKATDSWYKQAAKDEDEYCNVSGAKLGKNLPTHGVGSALKVDLNGKPAWVDTNTKREECEHESDGVRYSSVCEGMTQFKCKKCGEFYR